MDFAGGVADEPPDTLAQIPLRPAPPLNSISKRQLKPEEWTALKPVIEQLYIVEGKTFEKVASILQEHYNFYPT